MAVAYALNPSQPRHESLVPLSFRQADASLRLLLERQDEHAKEARRLLEPALRPEVLRNTLLGLAANHLPKGRLGSGR